MKRTQDRIIRRGLQQSLEEFTAQIGCTPDKARICWRLQGLRALHPRTLGQFPWEDLTALVDHPGPRIAPGVAVPTKPVLQVRS